MAAARKILVLYLVHLFDYAGAVDYRRHDRLYRIEAGVDRSKRHTTLEGVIPRLAVRSPADRYRRSAGGY